MEARDAILVLNQVITDNEQLKTSMVELQKIAHENEQLRSIVLERDIELMMARIELKKYLEADVPSQKSDVPSPTSGAPGPGPAPAAAAAAGPAASPAPAVKPRSDGAAGPNRRGGALDDFENRCLRYLAAHPLSSLKDFGKLFDAHEKTIEYRLAGLIKLGKIKRIKDGEQRTSPVRYSLAEPGEKFQVKEEVKQKFKELHKLESGSDRDQEISKSVLEVLKEKPGSVINVISHDITDKLVVKGGVPISKIRRILIELEENKKIRSEKRTAQFGPITGYFLTEAS